jgi:hypothetical protein
LHVVVACHHLHRVVRPWDSGELAFGGFLGGRGPGHGVDTLQPCIYIEGRHNDLRPWCGGEEPLQGLHAFARQDALAQYLIGERGGGGGPDGRLVAELRPVGHAAHHEIRDGRDNVALLVAQRDVEQRYALPTAVFEPDQAEQLAW